MVRLNLQFFGGRGAGSASSVFGGQNTGIDGQDNTVNDLPARMNQMYNGNQMSVDHTTSVFRDSHVSDTMEHGILHDDDGFVTTYKHGNDSSVSWERSELAGKHLIHNHPDHGYAHFSKADLDTWSDTGLKSITASSKSFDFTVTKGAHFKASEFKAALSTAKSTKGDYNRAVDAWLRQNQTKYGYKYKAKTYDAGASIAKWRKG